MTSTAGQENDSRQALLHQERHDTADYDNGAMLVDE